MSYTVNMDQNHESSHENFNMRGMVHKNSVEKLEYLKRQKSLEKQKKYFVRQHSRDENEIKQILQRLQLEQQFHDQEQLDGISVSGKRAYFGSVFQKKSVLILVPSDSLSTLLENFDFTSLQDGQSTVYTSGCHCIVLIF